MSVIMFQDRFAELVLSGAKRQTVRRVRKRPIKPGDSLSLRKWSGAAYRTKQIPLKEAVCVSVNNVRIDKGKIQVLCSSENPSRIVDLDSFAKADGFESWEDMVNWFDKTHGLPFEGILIRW